MVRSRLSRRRRGSSIIEVLLAMTILAFMMVGILQMFTLSMLVNAGSAARTQMLFKAQEVVENIRIACFLAKNGNMALANQLLVPDSGGSPGFTGTGPTFKLVGGAPGSAITYDLPYISTGSNWTTSGPGSPMTYAEAWGPRGADVIEVSDGEFKISYEVTVEPVPGYSVGTKDVYTIRVLCTPQPPSSTGKRFFGLIGGKRVDYVAQIIP